MDWTEIKQKYITDGASYKELSEKYGAKYRTIAWHGKTENWPEKRAEYIRKMQQEPQKTDEDEAKRVSRLYTVSDKLLDKLERAVDELDLYLAEDKIKTKIVEYDNADRPDKPTKEIITEETKISSAASIIDRRGLQQVIEALGAIKEVQGLRSNRDAEEQLMRIAKLRRDAKETDGVQSDIRVIFESDEEDFFQ